MAARVMDRVEDFYADDADEPGGNSDVMGAATYDTGPMGDAEGDDWGASGEDWNAGDAEGEAEGDAEGAEGDDPEGTEGADYDTGPMGASYDTGPMGASYDTGPMGDDDPDDPGGGKHDYVERGGPSGYSAPAWGDDQDAGPGPEEGEEAADSYAEDQGDQGPEPPATPAAPPRSRPGVARRIFNGAARVHSMSRNLLPHRLADRFTPKFAKKFMPHTYASKVLKKFKLWGDQGPYIGIGDDCAPDCGSEATFDIYKSGKGWSGVVRIPTDNGRALMMATTASPSKQGAANKAINLTRLASSSPALKAMVPPQARLALMAAQHPLAKKALGRLFRRG